MKKVPEAVFQTDIKPTFADDIIIVTPVKSVKSKEKVSKEAHVVLIFMDMLSKKPVSKMVIRKTTAESLKKVLTKVLANLEKDLKSTQVPKPKPIKTESTKYIE